MAASKTRLRTLWPELGAVALLLALLAHFFMEVVARTGGTFTYCIDDAYIHMAVAKNIVLHHVWGATQYEVSSPSSSPLWTVLLSLDYLIQGVNETAPLILNALAGVASLAVAAHLWRRSGIPQFAVFGLLLVLILAVPLPTVIFDGMEHTLHLLFVLVWMAVLMTPLASDAPLTRGRIATLAVLAALMTACRYESLFLVLMTCVLLAARKQVGGAIAVGLGALSLISLYGAYAMSHGLHFLPDSVLMKAPKRDFHTAMNIWLSFGGGVLRKLAYYQYLTAMLFMSVGLASWLNRRSPAAWKRSPAAFAVLFASTLLLHLEFARTGWFFRYESYLIAFGVVTVGLVAQAAASGLALRGRTVVGVAMLVVVASFAPRTLRALRETPQASRNIFDQQMQMAMFAGVSGAHTVGLFDLGFVSYLSDVHVFDLGGLGSPAVADETLRSGGLSRESVARLSEQAGVDLVMLHIEEWKSVIPESWRIIGQWRAPPPNVILGSDVLTFYVTGRGDVAELKRRFAAFSRTQLPRDIEVRIADSVGPP